MRGKRAVGRLGRDQPQVRAYAGEQGGTAEEDGRDVFGEALVVPSEEENMPEKVEDALKCARDLDWRIHDLALTPVRELPKPGERGAKEPMG